MSLRTQLIALGVPTRSVALAIPYMFFVPATVDRNAAGVRVVVRAIQGRLAKIGFPVRVTSVFDVATTRALDRLAPPAGTFAHRTLAELVQIVLAAADAHGTTAASLGSWDVGRDGSCVARGDTKRAFLDLQRAINRLSSKLATSRVKVDGVIGDATVAAARAVAQRVFKPPSPNWQTATCQTLAGQASKIATAFHRAADKLGAPKKPSRPKSSGDGALPTLPGLDTGPTSSTPRSLLPIALGIGGVALLIIKHRSKGR